METAAAALPDDLLAYVLWRLPPHTLAAARCVSRAWCAVVDTRGLLLPYVLPLVVAGIFVNYADYCRQHLFVRPGCHLLSGSLDFVPRDNPGMWCSAVGDHYSKIFDAVPVDDRGRWSVVRDHCNGLLLYDDGLEFSVVNPATRRWARLPPHDRARDSVMHLVFDPVVSRHYEVVLIPSVPEKPKPAAATGKEESPPQPSTGSAAEQPCAAGRDAEPEIEDPDGSMEWPPSPCTMHVFSSRTWRWEERAFARQGDAAGTVSDVRLDPVEPEVFGARRRLATYWQGALYVHCRGAYIMRLSLSNNKYQVIKAPIGGRLTRCYLGKSEKGVYFAAIAMWYDLHVWILNESCGQPEWVLKHENILKTSALLTVARMSYREEIDGPWVLEEDVSIDDNNNNNNNNNNQDQESPAEEEYYWWCTDEEEDFVETAEEDARYQASFYILGFHPFKEIIYFCTVFGGAAYHLGTREVQCLGNLRPKHYCSLGFYICGAFPYTPCMTGEFPDDNSSLKAKP